MEPCIATCRSDSIRLSWTAMAFLTPTSLRNSTSAPGRRLLSKSCRWGRRWAANSALVAAPASSPSSSRPTPLGLPFRALPFTAIGDLFWRGGQWLGILRPQRFDGVVLRRPPFYSSRRIAPCCRRRAQWSSRRSRAVPPGSGYTERRAKRAQPDALCEAERSNSRGRAAERGLLSRCPPCILYGRGRQLRRSLSPSVCGIQPRPRTGGLCRSPVDAGQGGQQRGIAHLLFHPACPARNRSPRHRRHALLRRQLIAEPD